MYTYTITISQESGTVGKRTPIDRTEHVNVRRTVGTFWLVPLAAAWGRAGAVGWSPAWRKPSTRCTADLQRWPLPVDLHFRCQRPWPLMASGRKEDKVIEYISFTVVTKLVNVIMHVYFKNKKKSANWVNKQTISAYKLIKHIEAITQSAQHKETEQAKSGEVCRRRHHSCERLGANTYTHVVKYLYRKGALTWGVRVLSKTELAAGGWALTQQVPAGQTWTQTRWFSAIDVSQESREKKRTTSKSCCYTVVCLWAASRI